MALWGRVKKKVYTSILFILRIYKRFDIWLRKFTKYILSEKDQCVEWPVYRSNA
jgi:hypothetical protein